MNPILEDVHSFLLDGKKFSRVSPHPLPNPKPSVDFYFSDNSNETIQYDCDRSGFMEWWDQVVAYLRFAKSATDAFEASNPE